MFDISLSQNVIYKFHVLMLIFYFMDIYERFVGILAGLNDT